MNNNGWQPDMVVGIDFGMTCSGVAWSMGPEWPEPRTMQHWPGKLGHELRNKVESSVSYDVNTDQLSTWGFLCNPEDDRFEYNALFKLNLDPDYQDPIEGAPTCAEARRWYHDYLRSLYHHIMRHFDDSIARFSSKRIDFVFSVPVTWRKNPAMLAQIEKIIHDAGFGNSERERACVYLTEAEAAAIYASKQSMVRGEVFLVCDAGGGTTDLNVLRVESTDRGGCQLMPLCWTEGEAVGSTLIDWKIRTLVKERLMAIRYQIDGDIDSIVSRMMSDRFDTFKCSFGDSGMDVPKLFLEIPGLAPGLDYPHAGVDNSRIVITREELREVFDDQIDKMIFLIDKQLGLVQQRHAADHVSYLVLSGGLGSSPYVKSRIKARYETGLPGTSGMKVLIAPEPQLAVVHGLVMSRIQASRGGPEIYNLRCCPISFGIICREIYDPAKHPPGEMIVHDPYDDKDWAERQINWIIKQGEIVRADHGASQRYRLKIDMGRERDPWKTRIVMSHLPAHLLPSSMRSADVREVCAVETILNPRDMKRKNRHWYELGREYNRAEFEVRLLVGSGLKFQIWSKDGMRSRDHDEIQVQWEGVDGAVPVAAPSPGWQSGQAIYQWSAS